VTRAALAGVSVFALAYALAEPLHLPVLLYDPWAGTATLSTAMNSRSMRYFGDLLLATFAGLAAAGLAHRLRPRMSVGVAAATSLSVIALDVAYYLARVLAAR
jgi:hypothetical protein